MTAFSCTWDAASNEWTTCSFDWFLNKTASASKSLGSGTPSQAPSGVFGIDTIEHWAGAKSGHMALDSASKTSQSSSTNYTWAAGVNLDDTVDDELLVDVYLRVAFNNTSNNDANNRHLTTPARQLDPVHPEYEVDYIRWPVNIYVKDSSQPSGERLAAYYLLNSLDVVEGSWTWRYGILHGVVIDDSGTHHYSSSSQVLWAYDLNSNAANPGAGQLCPFMGIDGSGNAEWYWVKMTVTARTSKSGAGYSLLTGLMNFESPAIVRSEPSVRSAVTIDSYFSSVRFGLEDLHYADSANYDLIEYRMDSMSGFSGHGLISSQVTNIKGSIQSEEEYKATNVVGAMEVEHNKYIHGVIGNMSGKELAGSITYKIDVWDYRGDPATTQLESVNSRRMQNFFNGVYPTFTLDPDDMAKARLLVNEIEVKHNSPMVLRLSQQGGARWTKGSLNIGHFITLTEIKTRDQGGPNETSTSRILFRGRVHSIEREQQSNNLTYVIYGLKQICHEIDLSTAYTGAAKYLYGETSQGPIESNKVCYNVVKGSPNEAFAVTSLWGQYDNKHPMPNASMTGWTIGLIMTDLTRKLERDSGGAISRRGGMKNTATHLPNTHGAIGNWDESPFPNGVTDRDLAAILFKPNMRVFNFVPGEIELKGTIQEIFETLVALQPGASWYIDSTGRWIFEITAKAPEFGIRIDKPGVSCRIEDDLSQVATAIKFIAPYRSERLISASWAKGTLGADWEGRLEKDWDKWLKDLSSWKATVQSADNNTQGRSVRSEIMVKEEGNIPKSSWEDAILEVLTGRDAGSKYKVAQVSGRSIYLYAPLKTYPEGSSYKPKIGLRANDEILISDDSGVKSKYGPSANKSGYKRVWRAFSVLESPGGTPISSGQMIPDPCAGIRAKMKMPRVGVTAGFRNAFPYGGSSTSIWSQYQQFLTQIRNSRRGGGIFTGVPILFPLNGGGAVSSQKGSSHVTLGSGSTWCVPGGATGTPDIANGEDFEAIIRVVEDGAWITRYPTTGYAGRAYSNIETWVGTVTGVFGSENKGFIDSSKLWVPGRFNSNHGIAGTIEFDDGSGGIYTAQILESGKNWITLKSEPEDASGAKGTIANGWDWTLTYDRAWGVAREVVVEESGFDAAELLPVYYQMAQYKHTLMSDPVRRGSVVLPYLEWKFLSPGFRVGLWRQDYYTGLEDMRGLVSNVRFNLNDRTTSIDLISSTAAWLTESAEGELRDYLIKRATELRDSQLDYISRILSPARRPNPVVCAATQIGPSTSNTMVCGTQVAVIDNDYNVTNINQWVVKMRDIEKLVKANKKRGGETIVKGDPVVQDLQGEYFMTKIDGTNPFGNENHIMVPAVYNTTTGEWEEDTDPSRAGTQPTLDRKIATADLSSTTITITSPWCFPRVTVYVKIGPNTQDYTADPDMQIQIRNDGRDVDITWNGGGVLPSTIVLT